MVLADKMGTCQRQTCECDRAFGEALRVAAVKAENTVAQLNVEVSCRKPRSLGQAACCKSNNELFKRYNKRQNECCATGVIAPLGLC